MGSVRRMCSVTNYYCGFHTTCDFISDCLLKTKKPLGEILDLKDESESEYAISRIKHVNDKDGPIGE